MSFGGYQSDVDVRDLNLVGRIDGENLELATEQEEGVVVLASEDEGLNGDGTGVITAPVLQVVLGERVKEATEQEAGTVRKATEEEATDGEGDGVITSDTLNTVLDQRVVEATTDELGVVTRASEEDALNNQGSGVISAEQLGVVFDDRIVEASEQEPGIVRRATEEEATGGQGDGVITSSLLNTVLEEQTNEPTSGTWTDKGELDASTFPSFPSGKVGDTYNIVNEGAIGDSDGGSGLSVSENDILRCIRENNGGSFANPAVAEAWRVIRNKPSPASTNSAGIARFATVQELTDDEPPSNVMVSAVGFRTILDSRVGKAVLSGNHAPAVVTDTPTTNEEEFPGSYLLRAETIRPNEILKIVASGLFRDSLPPLPSPAEKRLFLYLGDTLIAQNINISVVGSFRLEVVLHRSGTIGKGWADFAISGQPNQITNIETREEVNFTNDLLIRMTGQMLTPGQSQLIVRESFSVQRIS